jgi:hypothetical protein
MPAAPALHRPLMAFSSCRHIYLRYPQRACV